MAIDDATKKKITKLFCEAITSYNEVVELRKSDKEALVEEFNSNLQFYSSIECAFRSVIEQIIGKSCPHNLHEMIEMMVEELTPNPLERGIDLFYILRYKDTRNQTVHNINICEVNAYPKLFLNGYRFIKEYVDKDIEVEPWKEECEEFDYALFNQTFRQSMYDNIRILVLPPLYDSKEKLEILTRYHWNVILDFDPYSGVCGSFSKLNVKNKKLVQLSQIEKYSSTQFSVEDVTWIMCDGDKLLNIKSFKPLKKQDVTKGLFIPSMLDGQDNWSSCYNSSETMLSTKKLLNLFFEKYFEKIQYNVQLFFVMDYAARVNEVVYDAVSDNLNKFMYKLNVHLLNESLSEQLFLDANNFEEWNIYNSTFDSFLCKVEKNTINDDEEEHIYLLPCIFPSDGKLSEKAYNHISQDFYVLHKGFPCAQDDINKDHTVQQDAQNFLRGEEASWRLIKSRMIPKLDVGKSVERQIKRAIDAGRKYFNLYHAAGFGGSTIAKQIAYCLSAEYPVLFMKKYVKEELGSRIAQIYNIAHKRIVVFVEEELFDNVGVQKNECLKIADATSAQVTFVFIARRPQMYVLKFIKAYEGDKLALQECISYMRECCEFSERKPGKANIIDYFAVGEQMGQILSKKRLFRMNTMYRTQAYTAKELRFIYGVLKQQGSETTIIPYDTNGVLMTGIEIHANLKYNPDVEASDSGQMVKLRFGFSYDGLKAENMSIRYADENEEKNEITQERLKEGDYTEFCYKHILTSSKTGKPYGIVGYVDANENCILRIGEITNRRINQEEFAKVIELCQKKNIKVQLIDHTEKGWVASLKSQKLDFENINS